MSGFWHYMFLLMADGTSNYPEVPESKPEVPKRIQKYLKVPISLQTYQKTQEILEVPQSTRSAKKYLKAQEVPRST